MVSSRLKWLDDGIARGEAAIAAAVLLLMIVFAALQALLHNLAVGLSLSWAHAALSELTWIDQVLQKGTLWLAFLGASLATHADRHIAIDALPRIMPGRLRLAMKALVSAVAGVICFFLARAFFEAVQIAASERPLEYDVLTASGSAHLCDASAEALGAAELARPVVFCGIRGLLSFVGVEAETPVGALQFMVPAMFLVIAARLVARSIGTTAALIRGEGDGDLGQAKQIENRSGEAR